MTTVKKPLICLIVFLLLMANLAGCKPTIGCTTYLPAELSMEYRSAEDLAEQIKAFQAAYPTALPNLDDIFIPSEYLKFSNRKMSCVVQRIQVNDFA